MGIGLTDGESIERLWSYLGGFSKITKEMTPENRVDLLTDGLLNYGRKVKENLGKKSFTSIHTHTHTYIYRVLYAGKYSPRHNFLIFAHVVSMQI